ncbi:formate dehydrogenase accessory sulfurtransferase FdhD [Geomonas subterranea]|uniref:Sulfur carrier protein FdhD n=1 Tax=Geomonas subterranea TaxID=2847989 RepID=A0ABX8LGH4_9BACT|nr:MULTISPECIES: formate dehydrogenase accessory sulfurtransferase FdhD [Geomonas]QXE91128.1 formate dehydrogenase accessory sulfurtransferase FdhD [Geomonas subterranea]QXM10785.1 formate dehydrogenase accessory sulfurtransferase FdhD [Geomonas subterranea]
MTNVTTYNDGKVLRGEVDVVREFPLVLRVNDRELVTLIASPHDLRFLVAGFLRLQGFVSHLDDFLVLSVCNDYGIANVRIKGEIPKELKPVLTSGCGTGITFSLPGTDSARGGDAGVQVAVAAIFELMKQLAMNCTSYKSHGGVHSAAVGAVDGTLVLHAEDLGRHNTIDRLAGEALLKGIPLSGTILATSGRVSAEMAAKAALLGIAVIVSRTSPTDMAIRICDEAGITLVGYLRGTRFTVYTHPHHILFT